MQCECYLSSGVVLVLDDVLVSMQPYGGFGFGPSPSRHKYLISTLFLNL